MDQLSRTRPGDAPVQASSAGQTDLSMQGAPSGNGQPGARAAQPAASAWQGAPAQGATDQRAPAQGPPTQAQPLAGAPAQPRPDAPSQPGPGTPSQAPSPATAPAQQVAPEAAAPPAPPLPAGAVPPDPAGFGSRGRIRRRARFLRKARELAYRDLGGLVYNLHRFGQRNDQLVLAKLNMLGQIDDELRRLESALAERRPMTVLREAGITACPRCAAIHGSEDRFCPNCGLSLGRHPDLPIAVAGASPAGQPAPGAQLATGVQPAAQPPAPTAPSAVQGAGMPAAAAASAQPAQPAQPATAVYTAPQTGAEPDTILRRPPRAGAAPVAAKPAEEGSKQPGRSPLPPSRQSGEGGEQDDGITEIIRPPAQSP